LASPAGEGPLTGLLYEIVRKQEKVKIYRDQRILEARRKKKGPCSVGPCKGEAGGVEKRKTNNCRAKGRGVGTPENSGRF